MSKGIIRCTNLSNKAGDEELLMKAYGAMNLFSLTDSIDTGAPAGRFFFHVMSALAEMERELIVERTRAGLAAAREQGRIGVRRWVMY